MQELPDKIENIDNLILQQQEMPVESETFNELLRQIHSVKGSAGTYGLQSISAICHVLEDTIIIHSQNASVISAASVDQWLDYMDLIRQSIDRANTNQSFDSIDDQLEKLKYRGQSNFWNGLLVTSANSLINVCETIFDDSGMKLTVENDGYQALGRLLHEKFDYLITTNESKSLNGIALISAIKLAETANKNIVCVLLTSLANKQEPRGTGPDFIIARDMQLARRLEELKQTIRKRNAHLSIG